jgi:hypothetical protein
MKAFAKIIGVVALVLMLLLLVVNAVNVEIPEGQEPTKAQQLLLDIKANVNLIAGALGTTTSAIVGFLMVVIQKTSTVTGDNTTKLIAEGVLTNGKIDDLRKAMEQSIASNTVTAEKVDILMAILSDTLLLSDLPVSVREKINNMKGAYDALTAQTVEHEQVTAPTTNTAQNVNVPVKPTETVEEKPTAPSYF